MPLQAPANYLLNLPDPAEQVQKDMQFYMNLQQAKAQNNLLNAQVQERQQKVQQQQATMDRQRQMQEDLRAIGAAPTAAGLRLLAAKYPEMAKEFEVSLNSYTAEEKAVKVSEASQLRSTVFRGDLESGVKLLDSLIPAYKNAGRTAEVSSMEQIKKQLQDGDGRSALFSTNAFLAAALPPAEYVKNTETLGLTGATITKAVGDARLADAQGKRANEVITSEVNQRNKSADASAASAVSSLATANATEGQEARAQAEAPASLRKANAQADSERTNADILAETGAPLARQKLTQESYKTFLEGRFGFGDRAAAQEGQQVANQRGRVALALDKEYGDADRESALETARVEREKAREQILNFKTEREQTKAQTKKLGQEVEQAPEDLRKIFHSMNQSGADAVGEAQRAESLVSQLKSATARGDIGSGTPARLAAWWRGVRGVEDATDDIARQVAKFRSKEAVELLPPGAASDADIAFVLQGFTLDRGNPKRVIADLERFARAKRKVAQMSQAYVEWGSSNGSGGVGAARPGLVVAGKRVLKNETWARFVARAFPSEGAK